MIQEKYLSIPNILQLQHFGSQFDRMGTQMALEAVKRGNTGRKPPRNSRGTQVLLCTFGGIIIGVVAGVVIGLTTIGSTGWATGSIVGFVVGGIAGSFVGEYLKKRKYKKLDDLAKKIDSGHGQGPILS